LSESASGRIFLDPALVEEAFESPVGEKTEHGWIKEAEEFKNLSRWARRHWLILRDPQEALWAVEYSLGATENQDSDLPWSNNIWTGERRLVEAFRVRSERITVVTYQRADVND
jgi:hypothetical protein